MKKLLVIMMVLMTLFTSAVVAEEDCEGDCIGEDITDEVPAVLTCEVEINGEDVFEDKTIREGLERGDELDIKVRVVADGMDVEDVQIDAFISGYEYNDFNPIHDSTSTFNLDEGVRKTKRLSLRIPHNIDIYNNDNDDDGRFKLRILISDKDGVAILKNYNLEIDAPRHSLEIRDVVLDPSREIVSGRGLLASVRVKNMGGRDEDGIKVTVSIPALELSASEYVDELEKDESVTSEDLYLRIPKCVEEGTYIVKAQVTFDEGYEMAHEETSIRIVKDETCDLAGGPDVTPDDQDEKTVITVPGKQDLTAGTGGAVFPVMISNTGATSKSYALSVSGVDAWGTYRIDPSNVIVVSPRKTETAFLYVEASSDAEAGEKLFMVSIESSGEIEQVPLTANVAQGDGNEEPSGTGFTGDWESIKKGLEIGLIVLVVLLVILGLIVGFNKLKGSEEDESEEISGQTYY